MVEREMVAQFEKLEDDPDISKNNRSLERLDNGAEAKELEENILGDKSGEGPIRNFDLNLDLNVDGNSTALAAASASSSAEPIPERAAAPASSSAEPIPERAAAPASSSAEPIPETKHEEYPGWSVSDMEKMAIDPIQLANLSRRVDEDEEDYDEEG
jgi:hypothetical protein